MVEVRVVTEEGEASAVVVHTGPIHSGPPPAAEVSAFDAPLVEGDAPRRPAPTRLAYLGHTTAEIADELAAAHDLSTPNGWTEAMRDLAARPEVLRRLVGDLTAEHSHPALFHKALKYVTENGIGRPIERHEHHHSGTIVHELRPPIAWTDAPVAPLPPTP